jgi:hypothetical protein
MRVRAPQDCALQGAFEVVIHTIYITARNLLLGIQAWQRLAE